MQGPTITMKIHQYSLMKDVTAVQNKPRMPDTLWQVTAAVTLRKDNEQTQTQTKGVQVSCKACMFIIPLGRWVV